MPVCKNCHYEWAWRESLRRVIWIESGRKCPNCGELQYPTTKSRQRMLIPAFFVPIPVVLYSVYNYSFMAGILLILAFLAIQIIVMPFLVELTDEQEPLW